MDILKNMDKKLVTPLVVLGLIVVIAGGFLFKDKIKAKVTGKIDNKINEEQMENQSDESKGATMEEEKASVSGNSMVENVVELSDQGFSPASVTVKKGTTVKFVNKTTGGMSVASDPHPTHIIYPELDQWKSSFKGKGEYDFTFDKVGTWGYHNHLDPSIKGTVVVTE